MPNSSAVTLIWRRSVALTVPSWIGTSYCLPVRLSVIVSVSAIARHVRPDIIGRRLPGHAVVARQPPSQVRHLAARAAERLPRRVHRVLPAVDAPRVEGGQTPLFYVEIWECGDLEIWKSGDSHIPTFPNFQIVSLRGGGRPSRRP